MDLVFLHIFFTYLPVEWIGQLAVDNYYNSNASNLIWIVKYFRFFIDFSLLVFAGNAHHLKTPPPHHLKWFERISLYFCLSFSFWNFVLLSFEREMPFQKWILTAYLSQNGSSFSLWTSGARGAIWIVLFVDLYYENEWTERTQNHLLSNWSNGRCCRCWRNTNVFIIVIRCFWVRRDKILFRKHAHTHTHTDI